MSRKVVEDHVLPIVARKLVERGELLGWSRYAAIRDHRITVFFEEQLVKELGTIGEVGGRCEALEYILEDLASRNPVYLEVERILNLYIKLRLVEAQSVGYPALRLPTPNLSHSQEDSAKRRRT